TLRADRVSGAAVKSRLTSLLHGIPGRPGHSWLRTAETTRQARTIRAMRLLLQQRPDGPEAPRFVQLMLQGDLLGGWSLVRDSGQIGGRSQLRREQFPDHDSALAALEAARDAQLKRGFQLMFSQGTDAPR